MPISQTVLESLVIVNNLILSMGYQGENEHQKKKGGGQILKYRVKRWAGVLQALVSGFGKYPYFLKHLSFRWEELI